jgi:hypothetical protein
MMPIPPDGPASSNRDPPSLPQTRAVLPSDPVAISRPEGSEGLNVSPDRGEV